MELIFNDVFLKHDTGNHPENKSRFKYLVDVEQTTIIDGTPYLNLVHNGQYIDDVQQNCSQNLPVSGVTLCSEHSFEAAVSAVGAAIMASETGGFALVRPPGHHAFPGRSSGFCIFNNKSKLAFASMIACLKIGIIYTNLDVTSPIERLMKMIDTCQPTRAEVNDVVSTLLMGANGLVLAAETAIGAFPAAAVDMVSRLIDQYLRWTPNSSIPDILHIEKRKV